MNKNILLFISVLTFTFVSCSSNNAKVNNDLKVYFDSSNVEGSFALLNNQLGKITVYNMKMDTLRVSPATSFKILNSLIGVQTGKITDENMIIKTDSSETKPLTLKEAFRKSSVPYFQAVAREIGKDTMRFWIDSIGYGNKNITGSVDSFWLNNKLKISPDEQLGFVSKLYFDQLPFQKYAQQMVRDVMLQEDNTLYKYSYATGAGLDEMGNPIGWVTGWIEENRHVYFFVTLLKSKDKNMDMTATGIKVTTGIMKSLGYFKGQK
ncbi:MAG: penicillin-binding transpeptidase domain-containing protein [Ginsengibacter sp.]